MEYNDEKMSSLEQFERAAKEYAKALNESGFKIIKINERDKQELVDKIMLLFSQIKLLLFRLGGYLGTGKLYFLTEKQSKKLAILWDEPITKNIKIPLLDKTKTFLKYLGCEFALIKNLIVIKDQSNFESDITRIINDRLTILERIFNFS